MAEGVGFEESMPWLPTVVSDDESCDQEKGLLKHHQLHRRHGPKVPGAEKLHPNQMHSRSSSRTQRTRSSANWAAASGQGMRAIFLDSGRRSCGTGVFLPGIAGKGSSKPACSPVLLPSRVVQALNLNVDELGLQIKPQTGNSNADANRNLKGSQCNTVNDRKGKDGTEQCWSPEIFLPKEWTY